MAHKYTYELIQVGPFNWRWRIKMTDDTGHRWWLNSSFGRVYFRRNAIKQAERKIQWLRKTDPMAKIDVFYD